MISFAVVSRWIVELLRQPRAFVVGRVLLGHPLRLLDPFRAGREDQLRAERLRELAALHGHRVRHHQRALVAFGRGHERQADAGVAAGGFDDGVARLDLAGLLRLIHHRDGQAVFDR
jgi:hypothetical protein